MSRNGVLMLVEHDLMRKLLLELMAERLPSVACAGVGTTLEALRYCADRPPAVLVFDAGMHCRRVGELAVGIRTAAPGCRIIALTTHALQQGGDCIVDGADLIVPKDEINTTLTAAVSQLLKLDSERESP